MNRPAPMVIDAMETGLGGSCAGCAALYLVDPTNKNVGLIMMQTLELAANKLGREMTDMISGDDYEDAVLSYDVRTHRSTGVARGFTDGYGRMYVLKVKKKPE
ncbi:MAG TPA: hypothetical protein VK654_00250 [Nitrospirota bacterium]|nr:hypothetical protein [Nitrospirota bacterium]